MFNVPSSLTRRRWLEFGGFAGLSWLTPVAHLLARDERPSTHEPAQSIIMLWLAGGPSQLETFDPHPGKEIAGETRAIPTAVKGIELAQGFDRLAEEMGSATLVRNLYSKEGDHERGVYALKTGYRVDPTVVHPSIGAICCHQLPVGKTEIPRHVSIEPDRWPGRGGMLGNQYDAFKTFDPKTKVPDIVTRVDEQRNAARLADRHVVEDAFTRGRLRQVQATLHNDLVDRARKMMTSEQLKAFDVTEEPLEVQAAYGDTPFGRGCLAARRLIEVGVRAVEVTLTGWDSHVNNHEIHQGQLKTLDPAIAALLADLRTRKLLDRTIVVCCGEFGRTPVINRLKGRDHWPQGFSALLAGGRLPRGFVLGETDPEGGKLKPEQSTLVADLHATLLTALGIDPQHEVLAPVGRPIKLSEGMPVPSLLT
jgi:uncharacterized protein (DUF1501 family)